MDFSCWINHNFVLKQHFKWYFNFKSSTQSQYYQYIPSYEESYQSEWTMGGSGATLPGWKVRGVLVKRIHATLAFTFVPAVAGCYLTWSLSPKQSLELFSPLSLWLVFLIRINLRLFWSTTHGIQLQNQSVVTGLICSCYVMITWCNMEWVQFH